MRRNSRRRPEKLFRQAGADPGVPRPRVHGASPPTTHGRPRCATVAPGMPHRQARVGRWRTHGSPVARRPRPPSPPRSRPPHACIAAALFHVKHRRRRSASSLPPARLSATISWLPRRAQQAGLDPARPVTARMPRERSEQDREAIDPEPGDDADPRIPLVGPRSAGIATPGGRAQVRRVANSSTAALRQRTDRRSCPKRPALCCRFPLRPRGPPPRTVR